MRLFLIFFFPRIFGVRQEQQILVFNGFPSLPFLKKKETKKKQGKLSEGLQNGFQEVIILARF